VSIDVAARWVRVNRAEVASLGGEELLHRTTRDIYKTIYRMYRSWKFAL
jgi:hypothetical protein